MEGNGVGRGQDGASRAACTMLSFPVVTGNGASEVSWVTSREESIEEYYDVDFVRSINSAAGLV